MSLRRFLLNHFLLPEEFTRWITESPHRADFICPQAFGRNTYSDHGVGAIINTARETRSDIEMFEQLRHWGFDPGRPNYLIAEEVLDVIYQVNWMPVIGQWEVMYALWKLDSYWYQTNINSLDVIWPPTEGYLGTHGLFLEVKEIADKFGLKTPLLVAHPEHIERCYFLARKVFDDNPAVLTGEVSDEWYDQKSVQRWTRNKWYWLVYELCLARPHHRLFGLM